MITVQQLNVITNAVAYGNTLAQAGLPDTAEFKQAYEEISQDFNKNFEEGQMIAPVNEWETFEDGEIDIFEASSLAHNGKGFYDQFSIDETPQMSLVSKAVSENRYTLGPMYVPDRVDAHGEWTDSAELQKSVWDYVRKDDRRIRLQHNKDVVAGEWVEVMAWPYEVSVPMQKSDGTMEDVTFPKDTVFLGVVWEPWAWEMVKAGKLMGYSIGGRAQRLEVDLPVAKEDSSSTVSGPTVNTVHVDTVMGGQKKKPKKDVKVSDEDVSD